MTTASSVSHSPQFGPMYLLGIASEMLELATSIFQGEASVDREARLKHVCCIYRIRRLLYSPLAFFLEVISSIDCWVAGMEDTTKAARASSAEWSINSIHHRTTPVSPLPTSLRDPAK